MINCCTLPQIGEIESGFAVDQVEADVYFGFGALAGDLSSVMALGALSCVRVCERESLCVRVLNSVFGVIALIAFH